MDTPLNKTEMIRSYLNRIGFTGAPALDFTTLHVLQRRHLMTIPYENLDIMRNIPLSLELEDMFKKTILGRRGGYCFELNGLFAWLLRSLGFGVKEYMARFLRDEVEIPMRRHRVLHVSCPEGDYLCDVGVGGMIPRKPVPLALGRVSEEGCERYKLEKEEFFGYVLYEWRHEKWQQLYSFT